MHGIVNWVTLTALAVASIPAIAGLTDPAIAQSSPETVNDALIIDGGYVRALSEYGLFSDLESLTPNKGVEPYSLNAALFSDYAIKERLVYVPKGSEVGADDIDAVVKLPVGSVLVKTFGYPDQSGTYRPIETRLLLHRAEGWVGLPYIWDADGKDARLALGGRRMMIDINLPDGTARQISYGVPNKNQCKGCHVLGDMVTPIGPKLRNLDDGAGQLVRLQKAGVLPESLPEHPVLVRPENEVKPINARARAYLDINCAHCHNRRGPASNSGLFLTYQEQDQIALGIGKRPVAAGHGSGGQEFAIAPGRPEASIMLHRMGSIEPGVAMPELGRNINDMAGLTLIEQWIAAMSESQSSD